MDENKKLRYIRFGCGTLVQDIERKNKVMIECINSIDVVMDYLKKGEKVPAAHLKALDDVCVKCLSEVSK